jgi:hypothetical protein
MAPINTRFLLSVQVLLSAYRFDDVGAISFVLLNINMKFFDVHDKVWMSGKAFLNTLFFWIREAESNWQPQKKERYS